MAQNPTVTSKMGERDLRLLVLTLSYYRRHVCTQPVKIAATVRAYCSIPGDTGAR